MEMKACLAVVSTVISNPPTLVADLPLDREETGPLNDLPVFLMLEAICYPGSAVSHSQPTLNMSPGTLRNQGSKEMTQRNCKQPHAGGL